MPRRYRKIKVRRNKKTGRVTSRTVVSSSSIAPSSVGIRNRRIKSFDSRGLSFAFPAKKTVQMRYCTNINLVDSVGGVLDLHGFRANGINDPDVTGIGHQPLGHDQWANFYNHYRVKSSQITVSYANQTQVASQYGLVVGLYVADDMTVPVKWTELAESGRGPFLFDNNLNTETKSLTTQYQQTKFFSGQGKNQAQLGAAVGADPSEQAYFILWAQAADQTSMFSQRNFMVTIDYVVEFSEPKDLYES